MQTNWYELKKLLSNKTVQTFTLFGAIVLAEEVYAKVRGTKSTADKLVKNVLGVILRHYGKKE